MEVTFKLYANLSKYLPAGAVKNVIDLDLPEGTTPADLIAKHGLPEDLCKIVLVNGVFIEPEDRATLALTDGDALAIWPPVAGG